MNTLSDAAPAVARLSSVSDAIVAPSLAVETSSYRWLWPILDNHIAACELLWKVGHKSPFLVDVQRRTGLNKRVFVLLSGLQDTTALQAVWTQSLPNYYYTMLVGRLVLESPLRSLFEDMATSETLSTAEISASIDTGIAYVRDSAPLLERWFIGEYDAHYTSPLPYTPEQREVLTAWATRRAQLEHLFAEAAPELKVLVARFLAALAAHPSVPTPPAEPLVPMPSSAATAFAFSLEELVALRQLLIFVPRLEILCPLENFQLALAELSAFQVPQAVATLKELMRTATPDSPPNLSLSDSIVILQTLHTARHLMSEAGTTQLPSDWLQTIAVLAKQPHVAPHLRIEGMQCYKLLRNDTSRQHLQRIIKPLTKRFDKYLDLTFPDSPSITFARDELVSFKKLR